MSSRILTSYITDINTLINNPKSILSSNKDGIIAIFVDNVPIFYVISAQRLEHLLTLESNLACPIKDVLDNQFHEETADSSISVPIGKFAMYPGWQPDADFQRIAMLWGISLIQPVTSKELAKFITYWQTNSKVLYHIEWQKKLARSIQISRTNYDKQFKRYVDVASKLDNQIPPGFRG